MPDYDMFQHLVDETLETLPAVFREHLENVAIAIEEWPDPETLRLAGLSSPAELLGFYHGIPLTQRGQGYNLVSPDQISIYRQPILLQARTLRALRAIVRRVVLHELGHYFGIDDQRLRELGAY
jgi:predicted Zn-dependent protease with MMP-like domain